MDRYSTFGARFVAGFIDGLVFVPLMVVDIFFIKSPDDGVVLFLVWSAMPATGRLSESALSGSGCSMCRRAESRHCRRPSSETRCT